MSPEIAAVDVEVFQDEVNGLPLVLGGASLRTSLAQRASQFVDSFVDVVQLIDGLIQRGSFGGGGWGRVVSMRGLGNEPP